MRIFSYIFLLIIVLLGITFATLNSEAVNINYYVGHRTLALSLLLAVVFGVGCFAGILVGLWILFKTKLKNYVPSSMVTKYFLTLLKLKLVRKTYSKNCLVTKFI